MSIFEDAQLINQPDNDRPYVLLNRETSSNGYVPPSVVKMFGPLNEGNIIRTTAERLVADVPQLSAQQLEGFRTGESVIGMRAPTVFVFNHETFEDDWREQECASRDALAVNVFEAVERQLGCSGISDSTIVLHEMADCCWRQRPGGEEWEAETQCRRKLLQNLHEQGLEAISKHYIGEPAVDDIRFMLHVEGEVFRRALGNEGNAYQVEQFKVEQYSVVTTLFSIYRKMQDVHVALLNTDAETSDHREESGGVFDQLMKHSFSLEDLLVAAFYGDFDPSIVSPRHIACRPEFEEMRMRGVRYRTAALNSFMRWNRYRYRPDDEVRFRPSLKT